jgi:hypothetical protein
MDAYELNLGRLTVHLLAVEIQIYPVRLGHCLSAKRVPAFEVLQLFHFVVLAHLVVSYNQL